jgi:Uma2 family endonuclease
MSVALKGLTLAEYEKLELQTGIKHQYFRGEVFAMVGGTPRHAQIAGNLIGEANQRLRAKPCVTYTADLRVKIESTGLYTYPDASIVCGPLELDADLQNTVINPTVIFEVLSDSTEKYDRGRKSIHYRQIASLQELVLISQERALVECYSRQDESRWMLVTLSDLEQELNLASVGISIPLAEIYRNVIFDPPEQIQPPNSEPSEL